jgi:beta-1,4-mannosyl-glycoprotein beta-1,4-N-acetylglucosaminyltransferase
MIYDCFYLLDELDLLEARLNILNDVVDRFIIVESTLTFSGVEKPLHYEANKERFKQWHDKITYYVVEDYPLDTEIITVAFNSPNTGKGEERWITEFYQKEKLHHALKGLDDEDMVFISDIDELWNPDVLEQIKGDEVYRPIQLSYMYYFNLRTDAGWQANWTGTIATKYKNIKYACINHLRTDEMTPYVAIENGGWHFCSLGGREQKIKSWVHENYDTFAEEIWQRREKGSRIEEKDLPLYLLNNKEKYAKYFKS